MFNVFIFSWCPYLLRGRKGYGTNRRKLPVATDLLGGSPSYFPSLFYCDWEKVMLAIPTLMCSTMVAPAHRCCSGEGGAD